MFKAEHRNAAGTRIYSTFRERYWIDLIERITDDATPFNPGDQIIITKEED